MKTSFYAEGKYKNGDDFFEGFFTSLDDLIDISNARDNEELEYPVGVFRVVENYKGDTITTLLFEFNR